MHVLHFVRTKEQEDDPLFSLFLRLIHAKGARTGLVVRPANWPGLIERLRDVIGLESGPASRFRKTGTRPAPGLNATERDWDSIESGIAEACAIINSSGLGQTEFSCEGHVWDDRGPDGAGEPYILFHPFDEERAAALVPALMAISGKGYTCEVEWDNLFGTARMTIRLIISYNCRYGNKSKAGQFARKAVMERAREHLTLVLRNELSTTLPKEGDTHGK